jgi:uncharacterized protein (DUF1330 family)
MSLYALNLFDLADNEDYLEYSRHSVAAVQRYGGRVTALGKLSQDAPVQLGDTLPRQALVLVEWPSREAFQAFLDDPEHAGLHPLRENGTTRYLWWAYDRIEDLRPLLKGRP